MRLQLFLLLFFTFSVETFSQKYLLKEDVNKDTLIPKVGNKRKYDFANYTGYGFAAGAHTNKPPSNISYLNSWQFRQGIWSRVKVNKWYALGSYFEYARDEYRMKSPLIKDSLNTLKTLWTKQVNNNLVLGIFNRINIKSDKFFIDLGGYYAFDCMSRIITKIKPVNSDYQYKRTVYNRPSIMNRSNYGVDLRLSYGAISLYSRYRISSLYKNKDYDLPKVIIGVVIDYKD